MIDAPERIWIDDYPFENNWNPGHHEVGEDFCLGNYIRADLIPQWRPIEEAPKDGSWFMGWDPDQENEFPAACALPMQWSHEDKQFVRWYASGGGWENVNPTHFMPLPQGPEV